MSGAMSCRLSVSPPRRVAELVRAEVADLYRDLVRAGRRDDFRWLARSQGVPAERIDELWVFLRVARDFR
jgi:hypothetical protein